MSDVTVSICIRGWRWDTLPRTIDSVLRQGRNDIEVIVGDDAGDLEDIVAAFGDPRLRYRRNGCRLGLSAHARALLTEARGKYVCLMDDDDLWLPGFLDQAIMRLDADASLGVVFTNYFYFYGAGASLHMCRSSLPSGRHEHFLPAVLRGESHMIPSATLMRREVWEDGERRHPILDDVPADGTMWIRAAAAGWAFYYIDVPLALYTVHPSQASGNAELMLDRNVRLCERFSFEDDQCERFRRRSLANAYLGRAHAKLVRGRLREALRDVRAAREASPHWLGVRGTALLLGLPAFARRLVRRHPRFSRLFESARHAYKRAAA